MSKQQTISARVLAIALAGAVALASHAAPLTHTEYQTEKDRIKADHEAALRACDGLIDPDARDMGTSEKDSPPLNKLEFQDPSNAKGICVEAANGKQNVALAELQYRRSGSDDDRAKLAIAKAEADHDVAQQKCDELTPNANAVCINEADKQEARAKKADPK